MALRQTLSRLGASVLLVARQRLELAALDVEEELLRLSLLLVGAIATVLMLTLALAALAATVAAYFWDSARISALLGICAVFALAAAAMGWRLARAWGTKPPFLQATLTELRKDGAPLQGGP